MPSADFAVVTAVVRAERLDQVERSLKDLGVPGVSVSRVKGYGEYVDFFARDWMASHLRLDVLVGAAHANAVVEAILESASTGTKGDGIVFMTEVAAVWRIRARAPVPAAEL